MNKYTFINSQGQRHTISADAFAAESEHVDMYQSTLAPKACIAASTANKMWLWTMIATGRGVAYPEV